MSTLSGQRCRRALGPSLGSVLALSALGAGLGVARAADGSGGGAVETIVIFRHGEKQSPAGLGQLTCQGLNRSLALPSILLAKFGSPAQLFAPDPGAALFPDGYSSDNVAAGPYAYVRPLATIEPTAIAAGLPVNTSFAYDDTAGLAEALVQPSLRSSTVFVAWEHGHIPQIVKNIEGDFGNPVNLDVPGWAENDYDSLWTITITTTPNQSVAATLTTSCEGLGDGGTACPLPPGKTQLSTTCPNPNP